MTLPRYPAYKDSGVEWLGMVPEHWAESRLKASLASIRNGDWGNEPQKDPIICVRVADFDRQKFSVDLGSDPTMRDYDLDKISGRTLSVGDLLVEKSGGGENQLVGAVVYCGLECEGAMHSNFTARMQPAPRFVSRFLVHVFAATYHARLNLRSIKQSTGIQNLDSNQYLAERWYWPGSEEQAAIAAFLDHETSKTDALIAEQQNLIALLKEKRQAVISRAVTKGLNPDVPMKDSGVEWLGEVPAHWTIGPVKRFFCFQNYKRIPLSAEERSTKQGEYPYYGASGVIDYVDEYIFDEPLVLVSEDGANLFNRSTPIAFVARGRYWVNNHAHILKPIDDCVEFWASRLEQLSLDPFITGSAQPKLTADALGNIIIAVPPSDAERRHIQRSIGHFDEQYLPLIGEANNAIRLLQERRSALISAAVTGKIDVRGRVAEEAA